MAVKIKSVAPGSLAERLGLGPGCQLLSVDGNEINDMLDYEFYTNSSRFTLAATVQGELRYFQVEKPEQYEPFGCDFATYLADQKHSCTNHCMFCFIDQLPPGLRESLYFKDDDARLSFLFGNYITMTNMEQKDIDRIIKMHISPINISVHTTNPQLRIRMMANKRAGETLQYIHQLAAAGIAINCQLVLCRGINDGDELRRTLEDLLALHPAVQSIAAVPSGLTRYREKLFHLEPYDAESAAAVLDILEEYGQRCLETLGTRLVYPGDEWYLGAGRPIPPAPFYEEYAQLENGVGMWRLFHDSFLQELAQPRGLVWPRRYDLVTGTLAAPLLTNMMEALHKKYPQVKVTVHAIQNNFFGGNVSVAGLVTATDILAQCRGKLRSRTLWVPDVMLRAERDLFLDSVSVAQLAKQLKTNIKLLPSGGAEVVRALLAGPFAKGE